MPSYFANLSRHDLIRFSLSLISAIWSFQMYSAVGNHPLLAWLYPLLIVICTPRFAVFATLFMVSIIVGDLVGGTSPIPQVGLGLQAALIFRWAVKGTLLRAAPRSRQDFFVVRLHDSVRAICLAVAIALTIGLLFRGSFVDPFLWAMSLWIVAWTLRPLRWPGWKVASGSALLAALGTAGGVFVLEIGSRMLQPLARPVASLNVYHSDALWTLGPNASGDMTYGVNALGEPVKLAPYSVTISGRGLRDREIGRKQPGEFRVLLLGDSFTFGWGLEIDQTIGRQLEGMLMASNSTRRFTVINAGVEGYGPWQERIRLHEIGFALEPDIVILQLYPGNDINNSLNKIGKRVRAFDPVWEYLVESRRHWSRWEVRVDDWLRKRSALYNVVGRVIEAPSPLTELLSELRFYHRKTPPLPTTADRPFWLEVHLKEWYAELDEGRRIMESDTLAIRNDCVERGIAFALYTVPDVNSVCDYSWEWNMRHVGDASIYERAKDLRVAEAFCAREGMNCIDLASAMRASGDPCELYYEADGHLTVAGAKVTAQALFDYLVSNSLR